MKKILYSLIGILITINTWAQAPRSFNYQAILRDNAGKVLADQSTDITISILQGSAGGAIIYSEVHDTQTNILGLINLQIGEGNSSDEFSAIDWTEGPFFIQVSVDGTLFGTTQLLSVPYALYAEQAGNTFSGSFNDLTDVPEFPDPANAFSGSFDDLTNIPENLDTDATDDFSGDYNDLTNKPEIPEAVEQAFSENDSVAFISDKKVGIGTETARGRMEVLDGGVVFAGDSGTVEIAGAGTRLMWIPEKAAFRAGKVGEGQWDIDSIGTASVATGVNTQAGGSTSTAMGSNTQANGGSSTAMGSNTQASGNVATAMGYLTKASGDYTTAMGYITKASGDYAIAMGYQTLASGVASTTMGSETQASGNVATAMGFETQAIGNHSTTMGSNTQANGGASTAMGVGTKASGNISTAMGSQTQASGSVATAMGFETQAIGNHSTTMGSQTQASGTNSTAMGYQTLASGSASTAMGEGTKASGLRSTAMGYDTQASGLRSTAIGSNTKASGAASVAMGFNTQASGLRSTAMGNKAKANHNGAIVIAANSSAQPSDSIASSANDQMVLRADGNFFFTNKKINVPINPTALINTSTGAFLSIAGLWLDNSDRNLKENFTPIDAESLIEKIKALEVTSWNYKAEGEHITHIGPVAQDFYRIYGFGLNDKTIASLDGVGVALATIKALLERNEKLESRVETLENKLEQFLSTAQVNEGSVGKE